MCRVLQLMSLSSMDRQTSEELYFPIPAPQCQSLWRRSAVTSERTVGDGCVHGR